MDFLVSAFLLRGKSLILIRNCTYPSQLLPHIQFIPFFSEAVDFSVSDLKDSSSCPFRLLSTGLNAVVRLPTMTPFSAVP